ncbi:MAG: HAD-IIIA family hydrolase [Firmicutes bacterium]|nr:HAD-IIIA family hydrolase [Bacillota bacterium]
MTGSERRAVFFDLQGTLGGEGLGDVRDFELYPFASDAVRLVNESGLLAIIITNQSHIGKGLFPYQEYEERMSGIRGSLEQQGAHIDAVYCCPHVRSDGCDCKKPLPGLIEQAVRDFRISVPGSYVIGDMGATDMRLAQTCGAKGILVLTGVGKGSMGEFRHTWAEVEPVYIGKNVLEAVEWILRHETDS